MGHIFDEIAGHAIVDDFRRGTAPESNHGSAASHGFDHDQPEGLRPVDWKKQGVCVPEELRLVPLADFADVLNIGGGGDHGLDHIRPIFLVDLVDFRCDLQLGARAVSDFNRAIGSLFRRDPTQKS